MDNTSYTPATELRLYSVREVANLLSISKNRVYDLIYAHRLPAIKLGGFKIRHEALADFLKGMEGFMVDFNTPEKLFAFSTTTSKKEK